MADLKSIGPSGHLNDAMSTGVCDVPCRCIFTDGSVDDFCIVRLSKFPPAERSATRSGIYFAGSIRYIEPSPFALPWDVRKSLANAIEYRMNWMPTRVQDVSFRQYTILDQPDFFAVGEVRGEEIMLQTAREGEWTGFYVCGDGSVDRETDNGFEEIEPPHQIKIVYAEWDEEIAAIAAPYRNWWTDRSGNSA